MQSTFIIRNKAWWLCGTDTKEGGAVFTDAVLDLKRIMIVCSMCV